MLTDAEIVADVQTLQTFPLTSFGIDRAWWRQHATITRLNTTSHLLAQQGRPDTVVEQLVRQDKVNVILTELIAAHSGVQLLLNPALAKAPELRDTSVLAHLSRHHETLLASFIEACAFTADFYAAADQSILAEAAQWAAETVGAWLARPARAPADASDADRRAADQDFALGICALGHLRYLCEAAAAGSGLPLERALLDEHDVVRLLARALDERPWVQGVGGARVVYEDGEWRSQPHSQTVDKATGNALIGLMYILGSQRLLNRYDMTPERVSAVVSLRRHVTDAVTRQVPPLAAVRAAADTASMLGTNVSTLGLGTDEERARQRMLRCAVHDVREVAEGLEAGLQAAPTTQAAFSAAIVDRELTLYVSRILSGLMDEEDYAAAAGPPRCAVCGQLAPKRCSRCRSVWYCSAECQKDHWKTHRKVCKEMQAAKVAEEQAREVVVAPEVAKKQDVEVVEQTKVTTTTVTSAVSVVESVTALIDELD